MAPTNPSEERRSGYRPKGNRGYFRGYGRDHYNRRTDHLNDPSVFANQNDYNYNNNESIAGNNQNRDEPRPIKNKKDRGGGRGSGARRKESATKNNSKTNENNVKRDRVYSECTDEHCPVCLNRMQIYAVGMCNHPVCSECSTRMRILCGQNECPICRQDMPKVIFTTSRQRFEDIQNNIYIMDRKYKICFEDESVQQSYKELLQHTCPICNENTYDGKESEIKEGNTSKHRPIVFSTFKQLDTHVRREHEMFYCDLCVDHLKIFTSERKIYSRSDLARHGIKGDINDSSQKGHPLCQFCKCRYIDQDELYRHLRRDHFFCHLCDADGKQAYYDDYHNGLRNHFRNVHYLCELENCATERFINVYREEINYKAHMSERHSGSLSKSAVKQIRTVDVDFTYTRPGSHSQVGRRRGRDFEESVPSHGVGISVVPNSINNASSFVDQVDGPINSRPSGIVAPVMTSENFPSLGGNSSKGASNTGNLAQRVAISSGRTVKSKAGGRWAGSSNLTASGMLDEEFPSLMGSSSTNERDNRPQNRIDYTSIKQKGANKTEAKPKSSEEQFPSLWSANSSMSNFREAPPTPVYRNISGYQPAWSSSNNSTNETVPTNTKASQQASSSSSGMITLTKKSGKNPAPMPSGIDDFPSLEIPANVITNDNKKPQNNGEAGKKKKNKSKKGGLVGEDLVSARQNVSKTKTSKEASNLTSAADLISLDGPNNAKQPVTKSKPAKIPSNSIVPTVSSEIRHTPDKEFENKENKMSRENDTKVVSDNGSQDNFPALGSSSNKISAHFGKREQNSNNVQGAWNSSKQNSLTENSEPSGLLNKARSPPPGFMGHKLMPKNESEALPPPGFQRDTTPIKAKGNNKGYENPYVVYIPPKNFSSRNSELLKLITDSMGGSKSQKFLAFKTLSSQFRSGAVSCDSYHKQCLELVDSSAFEAFFPELLCLLPDIQKQQELLSVYNDRTSNPLQLRSCPQCKQILKLIDKEEHAEFHNLVTDLID